MRHVWQICHHSCFTIEICLRLHGFFFYSRARNRMSSPSATSLLYGSDFLCFRRTSTDVYLTDNNGYSMVAARITDGSLPKVHFRQSLCPGLSSFSSPLVLLHVLTKPVRIIPKIVLGTGHPLSIHPSGQ